MTVTKYKSKSKSLRLSRGHLHSAKCRHSSKSKKSRRHGRHGGSKKKKSVKKSSRGRSRRPHTKKSRRALSRGGCWLTDMFKGNKPQDNNVVGNELRKQAEVQRTLDKMTGNIQNYARRRENIFNKQASRQKEGRIRKLYQGLTNEQLLKLDNYPSLKDKLLEGKANVQDRQALSNLGVKLPLSLFV